MENSTLAYTSAELKALSDKTLLVKYGGNAMVDIKATAAVMEQLALLHKHNIKVVVVHGGGPFIKDLLEKVKLESVFVEGHRKTTPDMMEYVDMALSGKVNGSIVNDLSKKGIKAVGLNGKDAQIGLAKERLVNGQSLGAVGDMVSTNPELVSLLLENNYLPVVAPVCLSEKGSMLNVNADMFAGSLAAALEVDYFVLLTDVDGLRQNPDDPESLINEIDRTSLKKEIGKSIQGGMIPKINCCLDAMENGVQTTYIVNGMKSNTILKTLLASEKCGTKIV